MLMVYFLAMYMDLYSTLINVEKLNSLLLLLVEEVIVQTLVDFAFPC